MKIVNSQSGRWILAHRWAILPEMLDTMMMIASGESAFDEARSAIMKRGGDKLPGAAEATVRDGIAIVNITGPIFPRANLFTWFSGGTSIGLLSRDFSRAVDDPNIGGIVLVIDSPGGEVTGVNEFANMVYSARSVKPVTAYVMGRAASAAYWIASAAGNIVIDATAELGSIGVVSIWQSTKERDEKNGVKTWEIVSSASPNKRPDPSTESGRTQIQSIVDQLAEVFVSTVARNRGVTPKKVLEEFGRGGTTIGQQAVKAGLADSLGSFETVLSDMVNKVRIRKTL
jgi:signal peptide peptidase SppA